MWFVRLVRLMGLLWFVRLVRLTHLVGALEPLVLLKAPAVPSAWVYERDRKGQ